MHGRARPIEEVFVQTSRHGGLVSLAAVVVVEAEPDEAVVVLAVIGEDLPVTS